MRSVSMKWLLFALFLEMFFQPCYSTHAIATKLAPQSDNSSNTISLKATSTVSDCITVEAVLLPRKPSAMLFGGYVADNYAVVKTTLSNHCANQQFILHNIYFDYSGWALSGVYAGISLPCTSDQPEATSPPSSQKTSEAPPSTTSGSGTSTPTLTSGGLTPSTGSVDSSSPNPASPSLAQNPANPCLPRTDIYTRGSRPGQVATVGALDIQDQEVEDSVFSPRNKVVQALTLIGTVAQGYAFIGSAGAAQGIGAYNTAFVGSLTKLWPDRRLDQEKFLLSLGYRTDQSTAIAKDDHGSYYAFFPIATFLIPDLKKIFLDDPAVFLNPAEAWLESGAIDPPTSADGMASAKSSRRKKEDLGTMRHFLMMLARAIPGNSGITPAQLLVELSSSCTKDECDICNHVAGCSSRVVAEKHLFAHASLNSAQIIARGVMTIDVECVPPTIDPVKFDDEKNGASLWTVTPPAATTPAGGGTSKPAAGGAGAAAKTAAGDVGAAAAPAGGGAATPTAGQKSLTGEITGKLLSGGTPSIVTITVPGVDSPKLTDYIVDKSLQAVSTKSSDSSLAFTLTLAKTLPPGSKLTFQVSRNAANCTTDTSTSSSTAGTSVPLISNKSDYIVTYGSTTPDPTITKVIMDNDSKTDAWQTPGKLSGTATGSDLNGGTIAVSALEIAGKTATVAVYIGAIAEVPKTSSATSLDFQLTLLKAVPDGSKITFIASTKSGENTLESKPLDYTVTKPTAAATKPAAKAAKPAAKAKPKPTK